LRKDQLVRVLRYQPNYKGIRFATKYIPLDIDLMTERLERMDMKGVSALVLFDPAYKPKPGKGNPFISIARDEEEVQRAVNNIVFGFGWCPKDLENEKCYDNYGRLFGKRACTRRDVRHLMMRNNSRDGVLFVPVARIVALENERPKSQRGKGPGIDEEVLKYCVNTAFMPRV
ncbi:hypothetical protein KY326_02695, partial [Candidatus Woesearchaeota archaeon]|nr:hypothetical protein [Candidatus Woesearchaeota archaeon]